MPPRDLSEIRISSSLPSPPALFTAPPPPSPAAPESADVVGHAAAVLLVAAVVVPGTVAFAILCVCARSWFLSRRQGQGEEGGPRRKRKKRRRRADETEERQTLVRSEEPPAQDSVVGAAAAAALAAAAAEPDDERVVDVAPPAGIMLSEGDVQSLLEEARQNFGTISAAARDDTGDAVSDDDNVSVLLAEEPRRSAQHRDLTGWGIDETEVKPRMAEEDPEHEPFAAARAAAARLINS